MNKIKLTAMAAWLLTGLVTSVSATETDVLQLDESVTLRLQQLSAAGFLPTALEIEIITGDIVDDEVQSTDITVAQAVEKYALTPTLERYIQLKAAGRIALGAGVVMTPPPE